MSKKVLIVNAVPTNNGDAALVMSIYDKLKKENYDVEIETYDYKLIKELYPEVKFIKSIFDNKIIRRLGIVNKALIPLLLKNRKDYLKADIIIGAPGGYINSYYGFFNKIYMMYVLKKLFNKKIIMYSQSVGPLNEKDSKILEKYIKDFDLFMVRDDISFENTKNMTKDNLIKTNDAAFMLPILKSCNKDSNKVAISVRAWKYDDRKKDHYLNMIIEMATKCINSGYKVEFISTCQGLQDYVDDSKIAKEIYGMLPSEIKLHTSVNSKYYNLNELREYLRDFKFTIGTRLHMCILSIMSGVPALNISYEVKGKECYSYLKLEDLTIDYNENIGSALISLEKLIDNIDDLSKYVENINLKMNNSAEESFKKVIEIIEK